MGAAGHGRCGSLLVAAFIRVSGVTTGMQLEFCRKDKIMKEINRAFIIFVSILFIFFPTGSLSQFVKSRRDGFKIQRRDDNITSWSKLTD